MRALSTVARAAIASAFLLGISATSSVAWADAATAERLFKSGLEAMKREDYPAACDAFENSNYADPSPGTQINLAICYEKSKKWVSAWTWYRAAASLAHERSQAQRETSATESAKRLEPQLHYVVIALKNAGTETVVKRNGTPITVATRDGKPIPVPFDPGTHTLTVESRGKKPFTKSLTTPDNAQTENVELALEDAPVDPAANLDTQGPATTIIRENDGSTQRTVGLIVGGAGILTGVASVGLFVLASNEASKRDDQRAVVNDPTRDLETKRRAGESANSRNEAAQNNQLIGIVLAGGAAVMLGLGTVLYFTAPKAKKTAYAKVLPSPILTPTFQGLGLSGAF